MSSSTAVAPPSGFNRLWHRELTSYPTMGPRLVSLAIVVLTTCLFYYQYYVISSVSDSVLKDTGMSFTYFVNINVASVLLSALTSVAAGISDKYGRANIIVVGVLACALVCLFALPNVHSPAGVLVWYTILGGLEGVVLVATPALVRDFSPQLGRASAMGFWTIGPVAGSLVATAVVSNTSGHLKSWQDQYTIAGIAGLVVFVIALLFLRELSPALRDQIMVSEKDRAVLEARARGIDVEGALKNPFRQMMKVNILGSAIAISVFLFVYYAAVSFFPLYFQTLFGYSESKANSVLTWMWAFQAGALIVIGVLSDKLRVRKPFMMVGGVGAVVMTLILIHLTGEPHTSFSTFALVLTLLALSLGMAFAPWMASYTETVEEQNPALIATGLSLWGLVIRIVAGMAVLLCPLVVSTVTTLVQDGSQVQAIAKGQDPSLTPAQNKVVAAVVADPLIVPKVQSLAGTYQAQLATAAKIDPATQAALAANPTDQAATAKALSEISGVGIADVAKVVQYQKQLETAQVVNPAVLLKLLANPNDSVAQMQAVQQIAAGLRVSVTQAAADLAQLAQIPAADRGGLMLNAPKVQAAGADLKSLAQVPAADLSYLNQYGTALQQAPVQKALTYLQATAPKVQKAAADSPNQWKHYLWIAVGGEILFLPLIFVMAGYWDPRKAKKAAEEHAAKIAAEAAKLGV